MSKWILRSCVKSDSAWMLSCWRRPRRRKCGRKMKRGRRRSRLRPLPPLRRRPPLLASRPVGLSHQPRMTKLMMVRQLRCIGSLWLFCDFFFFFFFGLHENFLFLGREKKTGGDKLERVTSSSRMKKSSTKSDSGSSTPRAGVATAESSRVIQRYDTIDSIAMNSILECVLFCWCDRVHKRAANQPTTHTEEHKLRQELQVCHVIVHDRLKIPIIVGALIFSHV